MVEGGCLCGAVRYACEGEIGPAGYCHCTDCRRITGSAVNVSVRVPLKAFQLLSGSPKGFTKRADSGTELTRHFCGDCGAPLYTSSPRHPEAIYVKAGSLDDGSEVAPTSQAWTASAVAWARIPDGIASYEKGRV